MTTSREKTIVLPREDKRTLALADPHGSLRAVTQALKRATYKPQKDRLIVIGDIVDANPETKELVEYLISLPHCYFVLGNHDKWARDWMKGIRFEMDWYQQGGDATVRSYGTVDDVPQSHINFFDNAYTYITDHENRLFVHGGMDPTQDIEKQDEEFLLWDRELFYSALYHDWPADISYKDIKRERWYKPVSEKRLQNRFFQIFIGHTSTNMLGTILPVSECEVVNLDTGCGWKGVCTVMDVQTMQYWQSNNVLSLYREYPDLIIKRTMI